MHTTGLSGISAGAYQQQAAYQQQVAAQQNVAGSDRQTPALQDIRDILSRCHETVSDIHGIADRACGIRGEQKEGGPTPIPNGLLDELRDIALQLDGRIGGLAARLSYIA